ncbi:MAG TPA: trypsin-like peptidase domain-containing protein [Ktedonobacteraceae bacterium]|nr:trypsin-like peptidase domain-containing protein [Ktedonobacteraceae bacterium]
MYKTLFSNVSPQGHHWLRRMVLLLAFVCLIINGTLISTTAPAMAAGRPGGNVNDPVVRAVDIAEPAVVRILTSVGGHLTVHFSATNSVTFPQTSAAYPLGLSGSGTFISAHGDILTADHVINPPHDQSLDQYLDQRAAPDVATYINQNAKQGSSQVTADQVQQALDSGQLNADRRYDSAVSEAYLSTSYTGPLSASDFQSLPDNMHAAVDRIEMESAVNAKDVAIIHVNMNDTPSVQLGDSGNVQQQDELTIIGFPGNGDVSTKPTDLLTSSVNKINVSSIKTTDSGAEVIQVGGNVEHGDSGGPALDTSGSVVGIVSFGLSSPNSPGGTSFLQASNSARDLVRSLNLNTTPGSFETTWSQAFADYAANTPGHWHKALQGFQKIAANYPLFKAVTPYLEYTQSQARNEQLPQQSAGQNTPAPNTFQAYALTIGAIAVLLILSVLMFGVVIRRRRKKTPDATSKPVGDRMPLGPPVATMPQQRPGPPNGVSPNQAGFDQSMAAFGAPVPGTTLPQTGAPPSVLSGTLRPWPCGHMNRSNARYCSICGEPAPPPPTQRRIEQ